MRLIDAEQTANNFKEVSVIHKYEELKIDGRLTVGDVIDAVVCDLIGNGITGTGLAPTVPAIPLERIKQLREELNSLASDYIDNNDDDVAAFADSTLCMFDNMIKEYEPSIEQPDYGVDYCSNSLNEG